MANLVWVGADTYPADPVRQAAPSAHSRSRDPPDPDNHTTHCPCRQEGDGHPCFRLCL